MTDALHLLIAICAAQLCIIGAHTRELGQLLPSFQEVTKPTIWFGCCVVSQVADDIKQLSKVKPKLPWSPTDKVKKAKPAAKAGAKPSGFGAKR
jgi:hypothetical protein